MNKRMEQESVAPDTGLVDWAKERYVMPDSDPNPDWQYITYPFANKILRVLTGHSVVTYPIRDTSKPRSEAPAYQWLTELNADDMQYDSKDILPEVDRVLRPKFQGKKVVDLGCGIHGAGYYLSDALGADEYVGVEMNFPNKAQKTIEDSGLDMPYSIAATSIKDFVHDLAKSGKKADVIIYSGLDQYSNTDPRDVFWEPPENLLSVLEDDGIVVWGGNIGLMRRHYGEEWDRFFEEVSVGVDIPQHRIYQKKSKGIPVT